MDNLCGEGVFSGYFCPIVGSPRWLQMINLHQTWYVTSLSMSDYCCGVRKFVHHSFGVCGRKHIF